MSNIHRTVKTEAFYHSFTVGKHVKQPRKPRFFDFDLPTSHISGGEQWDPPYRSGNCLNKNRLCIWVFLRWQSSLSQISTLELQLSNVMLFAMRLSLFWLSNADIWANVQPVEYFFCCKLWSQVASEGKFLGTFQRIKQWWGPQPSFHQENWFHALWVLIVIM